MLTTFTARFGADTRPDALPAPDDALADEWSRLLAAASSPQERDEINDVFGRAVAA